MVRCVADLVMQASDSLVEVDILSFHDLVLASMGLGRRMAKQLDLKLTLGMAERR